MRVGVFDSGVGGLTVLSKLASKYPKNDYIYFFLAYHTYWKIFK